MNLLLNIMYQSKMHCNSIPLLVFQLSILAETKNNYPHFLFCVVVVSVMSDYQ